MKNTILDAEGKIDDIDEKVRELRDM